MKDLLHKKDSSLNRIKLKKTHHTVLIYLILPVDESLMMGVY